MRVAFVARSVAAVIIAGAIGLAFDVDAHRFRAQRSLLLEPAGATTLHVIAHVRVRGKKARDTLLTLVDTNFDRRVSPAENDRMKRILITRALDGVLLKAGTSTVGFESMESKLQIDAAGIELMIHGTASLCSAARDLEIQTRGSEPIRLKVLAGDRPVTKVRGAKLIGGGFSLELGRADRVRWRIGAPKK